MFYYTNKLRAYKKQKWRTKQVFDTVSSYYKKLILKAKKKGVL